ncbi:bifunctional Cof family/HAD-like superfamily/HAD-superfamily hydrolase [Babesia duncani]|uniref:Bifunctional Cof family/HAD-like superfamily/HAD-superfamily hydrolase n=1 Tax=Babesia duncani TaxID=323732 RepID=A0AAD9UQ01_9APIC|nr:bifunctional Cof family/HAD-like superfamily/HAD-superfamily hydrolase [Babesia duncani]
MAPVSKFVKSDYPPKYFAVDIDGTILTKDSNSLSKNIKAFKDVEALGYKLFFCTGRSNSYCLNAFDVDFQKETGYNGFPGIYYNGALVIDINGRVICQKSFSTKFIADIVDYIMMNDYGKRFLFFDYEACYAIDESDVAIEINKKMFDIHYEPKLVTSDELKKCDLVYIFGLGMETLEGFTAYKSGVDYVVKHEGNIVNLNPPGVTKAHGVTILSESLGVDPSEIAFIGDGYNDVEIMQQSKISFAMGNASDEVKKNAKYVLEETCNQAGFAKAMSIVYGV